MSLFFLLPGATAGLVTVTGDTISTTDSPVNELFAGIRVNSTGTLEKITGDSTTVGSADYNQIDAATDWIIPNSGSIGHHVQLGQNSGSTLEVGSSGLGSWIDVATNPLWWYQDASTDKTGNFTMYFSNDGGATTLTNGVFILTIDII
jgi:hypothetical protein